MKKLLSIASLLLVAAASHAQVFDSGTGLNWVITDDAAAPDSFTINAGALSGTLTQIDIFLSPAHTYIGDLSIDVQTPGGLVSLLWVPGNAAANSGASSRDMISMFFADAGTDSDILGTGAAVDSATTGTIYRKTQVPSSGAVDMSAVTAVAGSYTFLVQDLASGDDGTIDRVRIHTNPVPEPATMAVLGLGATAMLRRRRSK
jgi:subtilisin-like proprotein convertase family protein